jgi:hypothetical protein
MMNRSFLNYLKSLTNLMFHLDLTNHLFLNFHLNPMSLKYRSFHYYLMCQTNLNYLMFLKPHLNLKFR